MTYIQTPNSIVERKQNRNKSVWALIRTIIRQVGDHRSIRRGSMHLSEQGEKDVGLTKFDVQSNATKSLSVDVSTELYIRSIGHSPSR